MTGFGELHQFSDPALLEQALTHPSYANEHPGEASNQRLEFLGDAVLQLIVSEHLLARFPDWDEGRLTKARARLVDRRQCAVLAVELDLHRNLRTDSRLGLGVEPGSKVLSDAFEALVAAIYVDGGLECARRALTPLITEKVDGLHADTLRDAKSELQEWCQARQLPAPIYLEVARSGPDHALTFGVTVSVSGAVYGPCTGSSKKAAQLAAAALALAALESKSGE
jgi:ribonuclease-3